jgi:hypothetical protein
LGLLYLTPLYALITGDPALHRVMDLRFRVIVRVGDIAELVIAFALVASWRPRRRIAVDSRTAESARWGHPVARAGQPLGHSPSR